MTRWLESLLLDLRYGLRSLGRDRLATSAVVGMLTLGVGANVAIFTLLNAVWLRPLPYRDANRLVTLEDSFTRLGVRQATPTVPEFLDVRSWSQSFEQMAFLDFRDIQLTGGHEPERVFGGRVTASFFTLLGVEASLGRAFRDSDNLPGNEQVVMISNGLWQRAFGADPSVIGRTVMLDGRPHQVVGVPARRVLIRSRGHWRTRGCRHLRAVLDERLLHPTVRQPYTPEARVGVGVSDLMWRSTLRTPNSRFSRSASRRSIPICTEASPQVKTWVSRCGCVRCTRPSAATTERCCCCCLQPSAPCS